MFPLIPVGSVGKHLPVSAGDPGSIPGVGRCPGKGMASHSSILTWEIPWTKDKAWQAIVHGVSRVRPNLATEHH